MSDPYSRSRGPMLGDFQLRLDPELEAQIRALQSAPPSGRLVNLFLQPNWNALQQSMLDRMLLMPPPAPPSQPLVPRGAGPATPRAAEVGDLMRAIWSVPAVQNGARQVVDQMSQRARSDWQRASVPDRALFITTSAAIAGGSLAGVLSNNEARTRVFNLVVDRDLPVPGVDGLTVRLKPRGGAATYRNIGGSGVTVSAGAQLGTGGQLDYDVMLTFDVARYLRDR